MGLVTRKIPTSIDMHISAKKNKLQHFLVLIRNFKDYPPFDYTS